MTQPVTMESVSVKNHFLTLTVMSCYVILNFRLFLADTPFGQVKLSELGSWLARRNKSPSAFMGACSRGIFVIFFLGYLEKSITNLKNLFTAWWRWQHKYMQPKRVNGAPFFQLIVGSMAFFYMINYGKISKYHWDSNASGDRKKPASWVIHSFRSLDFNSRAAPLTDKESTLISSSRLFSFQNENWD